MARVCLFYLGQFRKPKNVLIKIGLSWNSVEKTFRPEFRLIEPKLRLIEPKLWLIEIGWIGFLISAITYSNFTSISQLWASLKQTKHIILIMVCQQYKLEFKIHKKHKSLEPNTLIFCFFNNKNTWIKGEEYIYFFLLL